MKARIVFAFVLLVPNIMAQTLRVGSMTVQLGMTKAQFAAIAPDQYEFAGYDLPSTIYGKQGDNKPIEMMPDGRLSVCEQTSYQSTQFACHGEVVFKNGKLV